MRPEPHLKRLMSEEDQKRYFPSPGESFATPGVHPPDEAVPPFKTDKSEKKEQASFANHCLLRGYPYCWHGTHKRSTGTEGTPDFWVGVNGTGVWIEFKRDHTAPFSPNQIEFSQKCERQKIPWYVVYSHAEAIAICDQLEGENITPTL